MDVARVNVESLLGVWGVEGDDDGLTRIYQPSERRRETRGPLPKPVAAAVEQLVEYLEKKRTTFEVDLHPDLGTPFQREVWSALREIPYGEVRTYGEVARELGRPLAYRAVGTANARNPWPIIVPCHRVIANNGIGGYSGGLFVKRGLLALEGVVL